MGREINTVADWLDTSDQMCLDIVEKKYLLSEEVLGHTETVNELLDRVSGGNEKARGLMVDRKFIPGGRIIANRGLQNYGYKVTYSNCYVDPAPEDNIESIYETCKRLARTFSYGGGIGIDISKLAPRGAKVYNSAKQSTGAVSFVDSFSEVSTTIGQQGRRGALMVSIDCHHPDLEEFITHKSDLELTQGANMSVRVTDDFFMAVKEDREWTMSFTRPETSETIKVVKPAKEIMRLLAKTNYDFAEPGMLYWDRLENYNMMSNTESFHYAGTNPCGEQGLPAGGSCLLGSMNLSEYWSSARDSFDIATFKRDVGVAVEYLNEILDEGRDLHPLPEQRETVTRLRQIGLGVMGLADLFIKAKIRYGSASSISLIDTIGYHMIWAALSKSADLAARDGQFTDCNGDEITSTEFYKINILENPHYTAKQKIALTNKIKKTGLRNSQILTCAPTGTTSTIFNVSGGIEPIFALQFQRTTKSLFDKDKVYTVYPRAIQEWMTEFNIDKLTEDIIKETGYLVTSRDISWENRIKVQAALQRHLDASISSTINLPEEATVEDIENLYMYAYDMGLKGVTVYREGCKRGAILMDSFKKKEEPKTEETAKEKECNCSGNCKCHATPELLSRQDLGKALHGTTYYKRVACGHIYITINRYLGKPVEVFMQSSKSGGCAANTEALGRLASTMLRSGISPEIVIDSVAGVKCSACSNAKGKGGEIDGMSCSDVMARAIGEEWSNYNNGYYNHEIGLDEPVKKVVDEDASGHNTEKEWDYTEHDAQTNIDCMICPECGNKLKRSEGCLKCINCGFSKC